MPYDGSFGQPFRPFSSLIGGLEAGRRFQQGSLQDAYMQEQLNAARERKAALQEYGQTRDVNTLWQKSPEIAMQVEKFVSGLNQDKQKRLMNDISIFDAQKGLFIDNPDSYAEAYKQIDPDFAKALPKPEQFAQMSPQQRQSTLYRTEQLAAMMKGQMTQYQAGQLALKQQEVASKIDLNAARKEYYGAKTAVAEGDKTGSKNLPQHWNMMTKILGREPTWDEYVNTLQDLDDAKGKSNPSKMIFQATTKLLERNPEYQEGDKNKKDQLFDETQSMLTNRLKAIKGTVGGGKQSGGGKAAPQRKPLSQMTDDEIRRLIAEKQGAVR